MSRYELLVISLAGWYFHPGNRFKDRKEFLAEVYAIADEALLHLNHREFTQSWQAGQQESQRQDKSLEA